jgi:hypothetical protein
LADLTTDIEAFVAHIKKTGAEVESNYGLSVKLTRVLEALEEAAYASRRTLVFLHQSNVQCPDAIDYCLFLLRACTGVPRRQAHALAKLALLAHGYPESDLTSLNPDKIHPGNIRKRKAAYKKSIRWIVDQLIVSPSGRIEPPLRGDFCSVEDCSKRKK